MTAVVVSPANEPSPGPMTRRRKTVAGEAGDALVNPGDFDAAGSALPVFRGVTHLVLDAKGRLAIPARHRDALAPAGDGRLVLTADPSRCLLLYPLPAWEPIQARLMALSSFNEKIRGLQRLLVGHADDVDIDAAGRILVPPALRQYASLDKHVVLVGQGHKFELWGEAQWKVQTAQAIAFPSDGLPPELSGFSL
jgi:MraZ protein